MGVHSLLVGCLCLTFNVRSVLFSLKSASEISLLSRSCVRMGAIVMRDGSRRQLNLFSKVILASCRLIIFFKWYIYFLNDDPPPKEIMIFLVINSLSNP